MFNTLERNGWLEAVKVFGGFAAVAAIVIPAVMYVLAGVR